MARKPEGPPPPPTVQRLRIRYAKRGRLRFTSHRDFARAFERALRRARVPMAYSAGFTPHPKVSYANAAPTGVASDAEYLEIGLAEVRDPAQLQAELNAALPDGLDILQVVEAPPGALADLLQASRWAIELPGVTEVEAEKALAAFLATEVVEVTRTTKNGPRTFDARAAVVAAAVRGAEWRDGTNDAPCAILDVVVRHVTPAVRPDDVLAGLARVADLRPLQSPRVTRLAQGLLGADSAEVHDPLAPATPG
ncbi:TIGR03936 family radical SAM-associated protein [Sporichthya brevicatena]|uniref:TIGR03936 family radical SAM-associated protein n=1 Tax=Sporichthya brevicatena TaxID=171442 RepID=A0ABP3SDH5_9ACTN